MTAFADRTGRGMYPHLPVALAERERSVLRALIRVMNHRLGLALRPGHVQRIKDQFGTKMVGHRPAHDTLAVHVEHHGQEHEPRPGRHVEPAPVETGVMSATQSRPGSGHVTSWVTNLPRSRFLADEVGQRYRLRWQVELLFKEWKSYANLHAFDTSNAGIAEGLVWTAIAASVLKRYLARTTQALRGVEVSTRKVAMCARHGLGEVFRVLARGRRRGFLPVLRDLVDYLASNATRSHPKRDRKKGRLQFGLEPVL